MLTDVSDIIVEDHEYLRHGDRPLRLTLYRPFGDGPFPVVLDLHGGAWNNGDRADCAARDTVLARHGIAAAALDFRHAGDGYPASLLDINYAVRWVKARAGALRLDPERVDLCGQSSGGHLAMLAAMRPGDSRYASLDLPDGPGAPDGTGTPDATVRCVAMTWPVINPLSRYRHALRARASANPPGWVGTIPERHDIYWRTEAAMVEGNPMLALERGEAVQTPPALWVQGQPDPVHDYDDPDADFAGNEPERFAANYRRAGGSIELAYIDQATRSSDATNMLIAQFFSQHLAAGSADAHKASAA
jgi:acetyl esterase/lipase